MVQTMRLGIDIGSTTAKIVILDSAGELTFSAYRRHHAEILATLLDVLSEAAAALGNFDAGILVTGSAGLGIAEKYDLPFIQEVVASAEVVRQQYPQVRTLIDIGGEDAKMIFFDKEGRPDIRMNGSCAGGTGAFIDEMATLMNVPVHSLDSLASAHTMIYPMASRCGVFAKTDLQNLLSRDIQKEDIAASVFHAVVLQILATLSRGCDPAPMLLFSGGPLTFLPALKRSFLDVMKVSEADVLEVERAELLPALGAALAESSDRRTVRLQDLIARLESPPLKETDLQDRLPQLFDDELTFKDWENGRSVSRIERVGLEDLNGAPLFLGVDSGSTTTKLVLTDIAGRLVFQHYAGNSGNAIRAVQNGLQKASAMFEAAGKPLRIAKSVVTGYGEDLIRAAFGFDEGMVETLAHFRAAKAFEPEVSFILDIGGQDMKAIFVSDGVIRNIEINEACSSGCGSFIESFARSMGYQAGEFAQLACAAQSPCNLGTRCTVFMNSRVKQALRENAEINDISAGLAYSVIKNALHKVLKVTNTALLGEHIVVQGGTFRNPAVQKAMEHLLERQVTCPDIAELMGAYGAALTAVDLQSVNGAAPSSFIGFDRLELVGAYERRSIRCHGCENKCAVTKLIFPNGNLFYSGNRCERIYTNGGKAEYQGRSLPAYKLDRLFDRPTTPTRSRGITIGIPRVLNQFENYPFWHALFYESGLEVTLSAPSNNEIYKKGAAHIMSENLCYPAKLVSGHIMDLIEKRVDRIFFPMVFYEQNQFEDAANCYNCPVVSGYADVVRSAIDPEVKFGIPLDMPPVNLDDTKLLQKVCVKYLKDLGVPYTTARRAFRKALEADQAYKADVREEAASILSDAKAAGRPVVLLLGRPYHIDPAINHKIPDILTGFGADVITEDGIPIRDPQMLDNPHVMTQWEYINRYYHAARWAAGRENIVVVQLNSFGCGPDPFILEEVRAILNEFGKNPTVIRIDEIESPGSTRLRLRSMMESIRQQSEKKAVEYRPRPSVRLFKKEDRERTLIVPDFSPFCSPPIVRPFVDMGYRIASLPPANRQSVDVGLKYVHNEICYPGIITIGDLVKALQSGEYDPARTAIGFSQTGGQCRASSYPSMVKKALIASGFEDVPVVTFSTNLQTLNDQPGFEFDVMEYMKKAVLGMMFTDALSDMYHATAARERSKGTAWAAADKYLARLMSGEIALERQSLLGALDEAVGEFNEIEVDDGPYPKVGIVGEIYVKYNAFSNNYAADWLMSHGLEVVMPTFVEFFAGGIVGVQNKVRTFIQRHNFQWLLSYYGDLIIQSHLERFGRVLRRFRRFHQHPGIREIAQKAREIISLNHQYGEGWLIAGEIASFAQNGVNNVLCLQPFGCIANHVVAKGVQNRMKALYPDLNLLFLDADAGVSEVNFFNRMHFFVNKAKQGS